MTGAQNFSARQSESAEGRYVRFFSEIGIGDVPLVGGKNAFAGGHHGLGDRG